MSVNALIYRLVSAMSDAAFLREKHIYVERLVGTGSFSKVYLTRVGDIKSKMVATKVIDKNFVSDNFVQKFLPRELDVLLKLKHPFVIPVYSIYQNYNRVYINMEYAVNGDMAAFLKTVRLSEPQIRSWLVQILWALQYMHRVGVVHRDLKCENLLLTINYNVRVADFGFARFVSRGRNPRAKSICGTQTYLSPELLLGTKPYNPVVADVWAIGVVLFMMANNLPPFNDSRKKDIINKQLAKDFKFRNVLNRSESLKILTTMFLEPDILQRITIKRALQSSWIKEGNIETPMAVHRATNNGKLEENLRQPVISSDTLTQPLFSYESTNIKESLSEFNMNFTDIHKPDEDFRPFSVIAVP
ncbi:testis-specific serine/threonine-protein kinase 2-like [Sipha flava]|uniref:Testis-specific serine/threonine-protein kinase 2-like n=1 Tax=Sipha flava TaxID=143950 RepID=A0A8B8FQ60_9HEMI|nr:testis-specific serine/threonine-protein kinase 2-like [Sipha flava]